MPEFQIIESQRSLPATGTGVHGRPSTATGEGAVFRALGNLGGAGFELGEQIYTKQGIAEVTQKLFESKESFIELRKKIAQESDPDKILKAFEDYKNSVESAELRNGVAKDMWGRAMPAMLSAQAGVIFTDYEKQVDENYRYAIANLETQAIKSNNIPSLEAKYKKEVKEGRMLQDEAELRLGVAKEKAEAKLHTDTQQAMSSFAYENPEDVLSWKTTKDMMKAFPNAKPTDMTWIQGVAQNKLSIANRQGILRTSQYYGIVHDLAAKSFDQSIPPDQRPKASDVTRQILQLDLSPQQKTELVKEYNNAVKTWSETGENLYGDRPTPKFDEIRRKILNKQIKDEMEIREWTGKEDGYGISQESYLLRLYNGDESSAKALEDSAAYGIIENLLFSFSESEGLEAEEYEWLKEEGLRLLEDFVSPDMTDREKKEQAMRIFYNLRSRYKEGEIEFKPEKLTGATRAKRTQWKFDLEEIWDELSAGERRKAVELLDRGATPGQLIAHYKSKK